jgi:hypothetical protein
MSTLKFFNENLLDDHNHIENWTQFETQIGVT